MIQRRSPLKAIGTLRVAKARSGDVDSVAHLLNAFAHDVGGHCGVARSQLLDHYCQPQAIHPSYVAFSGKEPVGFLACAGPGQSEVKLLYVKPQARKRGIASRLLAAAEAEFGNLACALIEQDDSHAAAFYQRQGFEVCQVDLWFSENAPTDQQLAIIEASERHQFHFGCEPEDGALHLELWPRRRTELAVKVPNHNFHLDYVSEVTFEGNGPWLPTLMTCWSKPALVAVRSTADLETSNGL